MEKKVTTPVVKGLVISLISIVYGLVLYFTGQTMNQGLSSLQYLILAGGVLYACISYANQMDNNVTFGSVFSHGFKTTAVATLIIILYSWISVTFIFPEMKALAMEASREAMLKSQMPDDQIETFMEKSDKYFTVFMIGGILFFFLIIGAITSLIGAGVAKKNPRDPFNNPVNA